MSRVPRYPAQFKFKLPEELALVMALDNVVIHTAIGEEVAPQHPAASTKVFCKLLRSGRAEPLRSENQSTQPPRPPDRPANVVWRHNEADKLVP